MVSQPDRFQREKEPRVNRTTSAIALSLAFMLPSATHAANEDGVFSVRGIGAFGCGDLVTAFRSEESTGAAERLVAWISGYLSHANRTHAAAYDVMPIQSIDGIATTVARLCDANQESPVEAVVHSVMTLLEPLALEQPEAPQEARNSEATVFIRPSVLASLQERLIARELLPAGSADGAFGPQTSRALTAFQEELGIERTGLPDAWTIFLLATQE
jgi:hypothetical protein